MAEFTEALTAPAPTRAPAVAVLPFLSLSPDPQNEYFADGLTEDVIAHLSKIHSIKVISRSSVMPFKSRVQGIRQIAGILHADTVLEGSVRRAGDRVRIVAQLIDAGTDQHLWAETYDRELTDIFAIQTDVALQIAAALKAELSTRRADAHPEGTDAGSQGVSILRAGPALAREVHVAGDETGDHVLRARDRRGPRVRARVREPGDGVRRFRRGGHACIGGRVRARVRAAAERALALDPTLGEAHCAIAYLAYLHFDWTSCRTRVSAGIGAEPGVPTSTICMAGCTPRWAASTRRSRCSERAQELDPLAHRLDVSTTQLRAGRYAEAAAGAARVLEDDPALDRGYATLGWAKIKLGKTDEGLAALERAVTLTPGSNAVARAARASVCRDRPHRAGARSVTPARGTRTALVRLAVSSRVRVHGIGRARARARFARTGIRGALRVP